MGRRDSLEKTLFNLTLLDDSQNGRELAQSSQEAKHQHYYIPSDSINIVGNN